MKHKTKFFATIIAMCLVITLGVWGILAVKTLNMNVGGNITFSAEGLSFEVFAGEFKTTSGDSYANITTQNGKMQGFVMDTNTKLSAVQDKIDTWTGLDLILDSKGDAVLHFGVKNNMEIPLYVTISTQLGTNTNDNMNLLVSANGKQILSGVTEEFAITFDIVDPNINAGLTGFLINVNFNSGDGLMQQHNRIDQETGMETTDVDYYYLEMGTYNGEPVRWRYVADGLGNAYDGTSKIKSLSGYYVLETFIPTTKVFIPKDKYDTNYKNIAEGYTSINANDYGVSDIRKFINDTSENGFMSSLGITADNSIYSMITARSTTDLYVEIKGTKTDTTIDSTNTSYALSLTGDKSIINQSDKFWLMSYKESTKFFADDASRIWGNKIYWLRSPFSTYANFSYFVRADGTVNYGFVYGSYGIRACFKI